MVNKRLLVFIVIGLGLVALMLYVGFSSELHRLFQRPALGREYRAGLPLGFITGCRALAATLSRVFFILPRSQGLP